MNSTNTTLAPQLSIDNGLQLEFFVYSANGEDLGEFNSQGFVDLIKSNINHKKEFDVNVERYEGKIRAALLGDKGYGFVDGYFVSYRPTTLMTLEQQKAFTDKFFTLSYKRLVRYFKSCKDFNEDTMQEAILYIYDKIKFNRGVNSIEKTLKLKYFSMMTDLHRKNIPDYDVLDQDGYIISTKKSSKFIFNDFDVISDEGGVSSYIETFAKETASLDDYSDTCTQQVNDMKMADIIRDELYSKFPEKVVDMYLDYVENFRNVRSSKDKEEGDDYGGVRGIATKYGISISTFKNRLRDVKKYIETRIDDMNERFNNELYPSIDQMTLKHIIFD